MDRGVFRFGGRARRIRSISFLAPKPKNRGKEKERRHIIFPCTRPQTSLWRESRFGVKGSGSFLEAREKGREAAPKPKTGLGAGAREYDVPPFLFFSSVFWFGGGCKGIRRPALDLALPGTPPQSKICRSPHDQATGSTRVGAPARRVRPPPYGCHRRRARVQLDRRWRD